MENHEKQIICKKIIDTCEHILQSSVENKNILNCLTLTYYKLLLIEKQIPIKNDIMDYLSLGIICLHSNEYCHPNPHSPETSTCEENI
jgi:hypothetical protein